MNNIFRRIIVMAWLKAFFGALFTLLLLLSVGNIVTGVLRSNVTFFEVIVNHTIVIFDYLQKIFPISALIASLFSINFLVNRNELTALFSLGMTRVRFLTTVALLAGFIAFIQVMLVGFVQPAVVQKARELLQDSSSKFKNLDKQGIRSSTLNTGKTWFRSDDYFFSFETYDPVREILNNPTFFITGKDFQLSKVLRADKAVYKKNRTWELLNVQTISNIKRDGFLNTDSKKNQLIELHETPDSFKQIEADIKILDLTNLWKYVRKLKFAKINTSVYEIIFYQKISTAILTILFSLLASVPIFNPNRRGSSFGKNLFFVMVFTIVYWLLDSYMMELGGNNILSPVAASFLLPGIFIIYLFLFFYQKRHITG